MSEWTGLVAGLASAALLGVAAVVQAQAARRLEVARPGLVGFVLRGSGTRGR